MSEERFARLAEAFELSELESNVAALCLGPELDPQAVTPTVGLALSRFCEDFDAQLLARSSFRPAAPLCRWILVPASDAATLARPLRLHPRIASFLLGDDTLDDTLRLPAPVARWVNPHGELSFIWSEEQQQQIDAISAPMLCQLDGPEGSGRASFAESICAARELPMLVCDAASLGEERTLALFREVRLYGAALYLAGPVPQEVARLVAHEIDRWPGLVFTTGAIAAQRPRITIAFGIPDARVRRQLWLRHVDDPDVASRLASLFRFLPAQIDDAATLAEGRSESELIAACRRLSSRNLVSFATKVPLRRGWDDLVLPKAHFEQLAELVGHVRHQSRVYDDWGFHAKVSAGRGIVALFSGPSGTGKTLTAEVVACDLGLDLYRIDLASLISKYIGETEKNLARVFDDGERSGAILFFDEADAVFGKRSEVKDAHDRYANIETSYLLQRIEDYPGLVILATNMGRNIDAAFHRRMSFVIDFPLPDAAQRRRIWRGIFPAAAPLEHDVDFDFLSERFVLSGGHIRNIAVAAAFRAAGNGGVIGMQHLLLSLKREYQKLGKVCERAELGRYYDLVR